MSQQVNITQRELRNTPQRAALSSFRTPARKTPLQIVQSAETGRQLRSATKAKATHADTPTRNYATPIAAKRKRSAKEPALAAIQDSPAKSPSRKSKSVDSDSDSEKDTVPFSVWKPTPKKAKASSADRRTSGAWLYFTEDRRSRTNGRKVSKQRSYSPSALYWH